MSGWIKLHRKMKEWAWYKDVPTCHLFKHLLLTVKYEPSQYRGIELNAGEMVTGRKVLASDTGLTEQQVRTSLNKLVKSHDITIKTTNRYTIISVSNFMAYQSSDYSDGGEQPAKQPTTNQQSNQQPNQQNNQQATNRATNKYGTSNASNSIAYHSSDNQQQPAKQPTNNQHYNQQPNQQSNQQTTSTATTIKEERNKEQRRKKRESGAEKSDPLAHTLSLFLMESICHWMPSHKLSNRQQPPQKWLDDMHQLIHTDGRTEEQIRYMIRYLFLKDTETGRFWAKNIQSVEAMQKHFDRIAAEIREENDSLRSPKSPKTYTYLKMNELIMDGKYKQENFVILNGKDNRPHISDPVTGKPMWRLKELRSA